MKRFLLLITLTVVVARAEPPPHHYYYVDPDLIRETYEKLKSNSDLSESLRQRLRVVLRRKPNCRDNLVAMGLESDVAQEWTRQLDLGGSTEHALRVKLLDSLTLALQEISCGAVWKS